MVRSIEGPFAIVTADQFLYPQYGTIYEKALEFEQSWLPWMAEKAAERIAEVEAQPPENRRVAASVWNHWQRLAASAPSVDEAAEAQEATGSEAG